MHPPPHLSLFIHSFCSSTRIVSLHEPTDTTTGNILLPAHLPLPGGVRGLLKGVDLRHLAELHPGRHFLLQAVHVRETEPGGHLASSFFHFLSFPDNERDKANLYALLGFVLEWMQHILYVLPVGIVTSDSATRLSDFPPYLPFEFYFWSVVACSLLCGLIVILNASLRGKFHYRFQNSFSVWFFLYNVGSPMYVTFVTILFMALWCDFPHRPPTLVQNPALVCYSPR